VLHPSNGSERLSAVTAVQTGVVAFTDNETLSEAFLGPELGARVGIWRTCRWRGSSWPRGSFANSVGGVPEEDGDRTCYGDAKRSGCSRWPTMTSADEQQASRVSSAPRGVGAPEMATT